MKSTKKITKKPKVHYGLFDEAACGEDLIAGYSGRATDGEMPMHTTLKEEVTCKDCLDIIKDKKELKRYREREEE